MCSSFTAPGTGYSSLGYLWRFPFDKIKIDRSFMLGLGDVASDAEKVVRTITTLGRRLNMRVMVEGVENEHQLATVCRAEADQAQGYYFGRPVPASQIAAGILADFRQRTLNPGGQTQKSAAAD